MTAYAWRAWDVREDEQGPVLTSFFTYGHASGPAPVVFEAECDKRPVHESPSPDCKCGVYTMPTLDTMWLVDRYTRATVVTRVELHEPVMAGADQFWHPGEVRARAVTIVGPAYVHPDLADLIPALSERYGVQFMPLLNIKYPPASREAVLQERYDQAMSQVQAQIAHLNRMLGVDQTDDPKAAGLFLVTDPPTHVALQQRSRLVDHPGTWSVVGGLVEPGEDPVDTALREAWEEARLPSDSITVLGTWQADSGYTYVLATTGEPPSDDWVIPHSANAEAEGAAWVPIKGMRKLPLHPGLRRDLARVRKELAKAAESPSPQPSRATPQGQIQRLLLVSPALSSSLPTEVYPRLWLGGARYRTDRTFDLAVTVCQEHETNHIPQAKQRLTLPLVDRGWVTEDQVPAIKALVDQIEAAYRDGQTVYVQCHWGLERGALVVGLVLERLTDWPPGAIVEHLQAVRTGAFADPDGEYVRWFLSVEEEPQDTEEAAQ